MLSFLKQNGRDWWVASVKLVKDNETTDLSKTKYNPRGICYTKEAGGEWRISGVANSAVSDNRAVSGGFLSGSPER